MAKKKSIYEEVSEKEIEIKMAEDKLAQLNNEMTVLLERKNKFEMEKMWSIALSKGIDLTKFEDIISKIA